jgi:hypothetical protein
MTPGKAKIVKNMEISDLSLRPSGSSTTTKITKRGKKVLCCIFQRTGLKSNPTPIPHPPRYPKPQPPKHALDLRKDQTPLLTLSTHSSEKERGKRRTRQMFFREGEHAGIGWGGREAVKGKRYPKKSSKKDSSVDRKNPRWIRQGVIRHFLLFMV